MSSGKPSKRIINKYARHHYAISDKIIVGLRLRGYEVKGVRQGRANLRDGFVKIEDGEAWVYNLHIGLPSNARVDGYNSKQKRKLLLHKSEISKIASALDGKGMVAIPLELLWERNRLKLLIGLGKGLKLHDKRNRLREREAKREIQRLMKQDYR